MIKPLPFIPILHLLLLLLHLATLFSNVARVAADELPARQPFADFGRVAGNSEATDASPLIWQPLRATFRPLNRPLTSSTTTTTTPQPAAALPPEPLALIASEPFDSDSRSMFGRTIRSTPSPLSSLFVTSNVGLVDDDEDLPTRVPLSRFRPTKPPSIDAAAQLPPINFLQAAASGSQAAQNTTASNSNREYRITNECFECICEASTNCNPNSRCQTSDVRRTRCGMLLISYDQWLESGLSKQLVSREALARDAAADERAFYECVTDRSCAERLMAIYMQKQVKDCDKDGRVDCYDVAAIHQAGADQCNGESLLESQYWSDFNACFGFAAAR